jgi:alpha-beta hydrolase superfamily lysophospholipase
MRKLSALQWIIPFVLLVQGCGAPTMPTLPPKPSPTNEVLPITPVESAFAPENPTAAPLEDIIESHAVTFNTPDGATIKGELYGSGDTAVIFSVMGDCDPGWREFAQLTAAQGLTSLTYLWRGCSESGEVDEDEIQKFVDDLRGAIAFMREQGATKIILVGASLGGCASAKLTVESQADGLIVVASPAEISQWGFAIEAGDLDTDIPKLFIASKEDDTVSVEATQELFNLAAEPKEWQTYPGAAHGTDLFDTQYKDEFQQRILEFIFDIQTKEK